MEQSVEVSAKEGTGLDKLIEQVLLQSELLDLKANPERLASGVVLEARQVTGQGAVATALVEALRCDAAKNRDFGVKAKEGREFPDAAAWARMFESA